MGIVVVELCESNEINNVEIEAIIESEYPEVAVLVNECLSFCGFCRFKPYAMVNGKRVSGKTTDECLVRIRAAIEEELSFYQ
ncbi:DUF1450 domain-containing protein [Saliterribacillus persicus]|uniref:DUF1450 domain-containing protein n=1 Tax=Saliterribacillus persicus TaxID=930114 RepID=UPI000DF4A6E2|nr:DUF1450 domain-containing protein [Saliterribacillus persicus]